jgi:hypothetical protein
LYSIRRVRSAAYLDKRVEGALLKWCLVNKMLKAELATIRDTPPLPDWPFISPVQHTFSSADE